MRITFCIDTFVTFEWNFGSKPEGVIAPVNDGVVTAVKVVIALEQCARRAKPGKTGNTSSILKPRDPRLLSSCETR